jgi:hypothetical protein
LALYFILFLSPAQAIPGFRTRHSGAAALGGAKACIHHGIKGIQDAARREFFQQRGFGITATQG